MVFSSTDLSLNFESSSQVWNHYLSIIALITIIIIIIIRWWHGAGDLAVQAGSRLQLPDDVRQGPGNILRPAGGRRADKEGIRLSSLVTWPFFQKILIQRLFWRQKLFSFGILWTCILKNWPKTLFWCHLMVNIRKNHQFWWVFGHYSVQNSKSFKIIIPHSLLEEKTLSLWQLTSQFATQGYISTMKRFALGKIAEKKPWFVIDFCQLGFIGKMFKSVELPWLVNFFLMFYNDKPGEKIEQSFVTWSWDI